MSTIAALWAISLVTTLPPSALPAIRSPGWLASARHVEADRAKVNVWMDRQSPYHRGDDAQVFIKADRDAYVTVLRIDTDGRVRMLFPIDPGDDNFARGGQTFEVLGRAHSGAFGIDDAPGQGYVFAIASTDPFTYDGYVAGDHWDYRAIADGRVREDPYVAVTDLAAQIAPEGSWDYDMAGYDVEQHYDYPRFVCYDCHAYTSYYSWNPYNYYCSQYRIVIYDDPYYYPYRYYGTGAVYVRPLQPGPRYVFKDYDGSTGYVSRLPYRPRSSDGRTIPDRGRTSADIGGRGSVSIPVGGGGRRPDPRNRNPYDPPVIRDGNGDGHGDGGHDHNGDNHGGGDRPGRRDDHGHGDGGDGNGHHDGGEHPRGHDDHGNGNGGNDHSDRAGQGRPESRGNSGGSGAGEPGGNRPSGNGSGSGNGVPDQRPIRRGEPEKPTHAGGRSEPQQRPTVEPRRPSEHHDDRPPRTNDRPPPTVQPHAPPPAAAQPRPSPPPSRPTGAPELRRRKP